MTRISKTDPSSIVEYIQDILAQILKLQDLKTAVHEELNLTGQDCEAVVSVGDPPPPPLKDVVKGGEQMARSRRGGGKRDGRHLGRFLGSLYW